ncbi:MAG: membrane protein insertion efficiency factor YidD [Bacteroidetes bacterium]|nr:membrane protein insertion efficiency factor YidD [Bacteroidota bacterium]
MRPLISLFLVFYAFGAICQTTNTINEKMIYISFEKNPASPKRKLLTFKKTASYFNPMNYISAGALFLYQNLFSEQIQAACTYETSCSEYTKLCIQKYGFIKGTLKGFNQLSECAPTAVYEHEPVNVNNGGKIINPLEETTK